MPHRTIGRLRAVVGFTTIVVLVGLSPVPSISPVKATLPSMPNVTVSEFPLVTAEGVSAKQLRRLQQALDRFARAGLELPSLHVVFSSDATACKGHHGLFSTAFDPWRIAICSELEPVYEHELAHAWAQWALTELLRAAFMELRGYEVWAGPDVPWNERGVEGVAVIIQQGLAGLPLPPELGREMRGRLQAFEMITGRLDPRLVEWIGARSVPCGDRPTILSRLISDASGNMCVPSSPRLFGPHAW
jgi:hypothetical protein